MLLSSLVVEPLRRFSSAASAACQLPVDRDGPAAVPDAPRKPIGSPGRAAAVDLPVQLVDDGGDNENDTTCNNLNDGTPSRLALPAPAPASPASPASPAPAPAPAASPREQPETNSNRTVQTTRGTAATAHDSLGALIPHPPAARPPLSEEPPRVTPASHAAPSAQITPSAQRSANSSLDPFRPVATPDCDSVARGSPPTIDPHAPRHTARTSSSPLQPSMQAAAPVAGSLPADDGMRLLRLRIHEIRDLAVSSEEKAKRMHSLMTERYHARRVLRADPPGIVVSPERPFTPTSVASALDTDTPLPLSSPASVYSTYDHEAYNLTVKDLKPTFQPKPDFPIGDAPDEMEGEEPPSLGCIHYKRNVKIQCFDCRRWYSCRHCHDEVEDHHLNRKLTRNMFCMLCATPQPAGEVCRECGEQTAWYYCDICKLWDNDSTKSIYHCPDCGICRRGEGLGKDFVHCKKCNVCISIQYADDHRCIERATDCDCPICGDYMFTSSTDVVAMPCGHYLHRDCYKQYMDTAYKCPICKKSAVNMELQWRKLEHAIQSQPMPPQFADTRAVIHCNDCSVRSSVMYHWLGNQCGHCDSFNTNELQLLSGPEAHAGAPLETPTDPIPVPSPRPTLAPAPQIVRSTSGSYFLRAALEAEGRDRPSSADGTDGNDGASFSPYLMLQRVRSYSPIRHLLLGSEDEMENAPVRNEQEEDENDDDDDDDDSDDESMDEDPQETDETEEEELDGMELFGHR